VRRQVLARDHLAEVLFRRVQIEGVAEGEEVMGKKEKMRETHVYLPESLYRKLESLAEENDRSITGQVRFILTQALKTQP
jgi:hypothetical protein